MAKGRLRVRGLTLVPNFDLCDGKEEESSEGDSDSATMGFDRERLSHSIELSVAAGLANRRPNHKHGIEPNFRSKFWASESSSSDYEDEGVWSEP
jgi:hypothetical protein